MIDSWNGDLAALQAVLGGARMPVILTDALQDDHPIVFANQAFLDLTGYARDDVIGRNCRFLQGPETDKEAVRQIGKAIREAQPISIDLINYRADGSRFWNALFMGPVFDDAGSLRYFLGNQLDVTEQRAAEAALHHRRKLEAVGQIATGLAHTLTNLLQIVIGTFELMKSRSLELGVEPHRERGLQAARDAAHLVHKVLAFARKAPLSPKPLNPIDVVRDAEPLLKAAATGRVLRFEFEGSRRRVLLDPVQLESVLLNLVVNAREATNERGEILVKVGDCDLDGAPAVVVSVEDDGIGMPTEVAQRATEPFFTTKASARKSGMGLSVASGFVAQSHGRIHIESEEGSGTRVAMIFPATLAQIGDHAARPSTR